MFWKGWCRHKLKPLALWGKTCFFFLSFFTELYLSRLEGRTGFIWRNQGQTVIYLEQNSAMDQGDKLSWTNVRTVSNHKARSREMKFYTQRFPFFYHSIIFNQFFFLLWCRVGFLFYQLNIYWLLVLNSVSKYFWCPCSIGNSLSN